MSCVLVLCVLRLFFFFYKGGSYCCISALSHLLFYYYSACTLCNVFVFFANKWWWCPWLERSLLLAGSDVVGDKERSPCFRFVKLRLNVWPIIRFAHLCQKRLDGNSRDSDRKWASRVIHGELFRRRHIGRHMYVMHVMSCEWYITRRAMPQQLGAAHSQFFTRWRRETKGKSSWHYRIQSPRYTACK